MGIKATPGVIVHLTVKFHELLSIAQYDRV